MRNPLNKRLLRELKDEFGKYAVIVILLVAVIGFVSGFLIADGSMRQTYDESFEKYNIEDGYFDVASVLTQEEISALETNDIRVYSNYFLEEPLNNGSTLRIYQNREAVDRVCLMEGALPTATGEIALDRMYAKNNEIAVGDTISSENKSWKVTGYVALSDYSCLFSNNNDTMFDAVKFGVAIVTEEEFAAYSRKALNYRYAWVYDQKPQGEQEENDRAEDLMKAMGKVVTLENFVPQYQNQAIMFTGDDMGSDKAMMTVLLYMVIAILAFVFAITITNTISREANTIGTLRALGYTRGELVRHYLMLPVIVTLFGALAGNVLGYTILEDLCTDMYYGSYSLMKYESRVNVEAFLMTTVVPVIMMLVINYVVLWYKMKLSPLKFIRRDLARRRQKRAFRLNVHLPFFARFRLRIIFQNFSNYAILFTGIIFANILLMFGLALPAVLDSYQEDIKSNMLSEYQYMLSVPVSIMSDSSKIRSMISMMAFTASTETDNDAAEKFTAYSLNTTDDICDSEEILLYGIEDGSRYIPLDVSAGQVYISSGYADKYGIVPGDTVTLKEKYEDDTYDFQVTGVYEYMGALAIFMSQEELNDRFDLGEDYFSGYFSDTEITDINQKYIGSVIDLDALTKVSRQLDVSMGSMMYMVDVFAVLIFLVLIYLLSKIVIEKNAQSISMVKILGYTNGEINKLYISATSIMVVLFLLLSMVIDFRLLKVIFRQMMLTSMSGWIPLQFDNIVFVKMFILGIVAYAVVALLEMRKIRKIPMDEALKNVE